MRGLVLLSLLPAVAKAENLPAPLRVERGLGAEQCADASRLEQRVESILQSPGSARAPAGGLAIDVRFERAADGAFTARVAATGTKPGQRLLRDTSSNCDALSEAVSVAIALLFDGASSDHARSASASSDAAGANSSTAERSNATAADAQPARRAPEAGASPSSTSEGGWQLHLGLAAAAGYGLGGAGSFLGLGRVGARGRHWQLDLGAGASLPDSSGFGGGSVRTSLVFGSARACYWLGHAFRLGPCAELGVGRLLGEGLGYGQAQTSSLLWTAGGLGLAAEAMLGTRLYATCGATLWVPTRRQTFSVQNAGIAWESKPVAGLLSAGLGLRLF